MKDLIRDIQKARFVFICGNGGSSSTAEHLSNDLFSKEIKSFCLNSNNAIITMIGNDFGYEYIFSRQLELYGSDEDLLITISCSGTSPNIIKVKDVAKLMGMKVYSFPTFTNDRDYEGLEDKHMELAHEIKKML